MKKLKKDKSLNINDLSTELIAHIFSYSNPYDYHNLKSVCRLWNELIETFKIRLTQLNNKFQYNEYAGEYNAVSLSLDYSMNVMLWTHGIILQNIQFNKSINSEEQESDIIELFVGAGNISLNNQPCEFYDSKLRVKKQDIHQFYPGEQIILSTDEYNRGTSFYITKIIYIDYWNETIYLEDEIMISNIEKYYIYKVIPSRIWYDYYIPSNRHWGFYRNTESNIPSIASISYNW